MTLEPPTNDVRRLIALVGRDLVRKAFHEAAHLVAYRAFGYPVVQASLREADGGGYAVAGRIARSNAETIHKAMVATAAGGLASVMFDGGCPGDEYDLRDIKQDVRRLYGMLVCEQAIEEQVRRAKARAAVLVRARWAEIEAVAIEMLHFCITTEAVPLMTIADLDGETTKEPTQ